MSQPPQVGETSRVFLGMGTNLGDRRRFLVEAVAAIPELRAVSPVYETEPVGGPDQGAYLNIVVELATKKSPGELLTFCRDLELAAGRIRVERWGPRTLDVDILWIDGTTVDEPDLTVPHPRMLDRNFVMKPLIDLAPDLEEAFSASGYDPDSAIGEVTSLGVL